MKKTASLLPKRRIKFLDLAILVYHLYKARDNKNVGHHDVEETFDEMSRRLNSTLELQDKDIEAMLYCCNLLDEQKQWAHFDKSIDFNQWVKRLLGQDTFSKKYNYIRRKDDL